MTANVETMAYRFADRSDTPWHGLGVPIDRNESITTDEFRKRAGADWLAVKHPLWVRATKMTTFREHIEVPNKYALIRDDNQFVLSIVSQQYKPVQNETVFEFFREFCEAGHMDMETGGVLNQGRDIWALASIRSGFTLAGGDRVSGYLLFSNSHDRAALRVMFTPIRVVCANTLAMAHADRGGFRLNHKSVFNAELAKSAIGLGTDALNKFKTQAEFLASRDMNSPAFKSFLERLYPATINKETKQEVIPYARTKTAMALATQPGHNMSSGTWWSAFNAVTYTVDHADRTDKAARLNSAWFGSGADTKLRALELALEMAR